MRWLLLLVLLAGCATHAATSDLNDPDGKFVGQLVVEPAVKGLHVYGELFDLPPGLHALHIHERGVCTPPDFTSAGGHFNPFGTEHGLLNPDGPHAGDLPNIEVGPDGRASVDVYAPLASLEGEGSVFRGDGTSFVIHQGPDDYITDPAGAAGPRIACGVIIPVT